MPELKRCFEGAGLTNVRTVLSSGNVVFDCRSGSAADLERRIESSLQECLGRSFYTVVRTVSHLEKLLQSDPYASHAVEAGAKRVVSFLPDAGKPRAALPLTADGASVLAVKGGDIFTVYVPSAKGPVFMKLIEKAFGSEVTTRTWGTVEKCAAA